jgi:hypothetical protein
MQTQAVPLGQSESLTHASKSHAPSMHEPWTVEDVSAVYVATHCAGSVHEGKVLLPVKLPFGNW